MTALALLLSVVITLLLARADHVAEDSHAKMMARLKRPER